MTSRRQKIVITVEQSNLVFRKLMQNKTTEYIVTFERQKVTESTYLVTCATGTPRAVAALKSLAPSI